MSEKQLDFLQRDVVIVAARGAVKFRHTASADAVLDGAPRSATMLASSYVRRVQVRHDGLWEALDEHDKVLLAVRLRVVRRHAVHILARGRSLVLRDDTFAVLHSDVYYLVPSPSPAGPAAPSAAAAGVGSPPLAVHEVLVIDWLGPELPLSTGRRIVLREVQTAPGVVCRVVEQGAFALYDIRNYAGTLTITPPVPLGAAAGVETVVVDAD